MSTLVAPYFNMEQQGSKVQDPRQGWPQSRFNAPLHGPILVGFGKSSISRQCGLKLQWLPLPPLAATSRCHQNWKHQSDPTILLQSPATGRPVRILFGPKLENGIDARGPMNVCASDTGSASPQPLDTHGKLPRLVSQ